MSGVSGGRPRLGCIADDYTGGTDVAAALRRAGLRTVLLFGPPLRDSAPPACDAVVVSLKTRTAPAAEAVQESLAVYRWLADQGVTRTYVKYCSTFDSTDQGNIGPIVDAVVEANGGTVTVVCPASPEHGRTVYQGHLFVHDRLLSESSMRHHPLTPMTDSDLVRILARQTPHPVALLAHDVLRRGPDAVRTTLDGMERQGIRHIVADAITDQDLDALADGAGHLGVVTGAAGLARATGALLVGEPSRHPEDDGALPPGTGIVLSGSCSATTLDQVAHARKAFPSYRIDPVTTPDADLLIDGVRRWLDAHAGAGPVMIYSTATPEQRAAVTSVLGDRTAAVLEQTLAAAARHAVGLGARRIVVAGGETSGAVVEGLGVHSVVMAAEEDRGVPWCITADPPRLALLLKSGNFGRPDLLVRAMEPTP